MSKIYGVGGNNVIAPVYGVGGIPSGSKVYGKGAEYSGSQVYGNYPSELPGLELWCKFGSGITVTGSGVSQWDDVSGNGNHLKQGTDLDRPQKQADGSILCDGIRQFLKADAFTWNQPEEIFLLLKQVTWTTGDRIFDGNTLNSGALFQTSSTPRVSIYAGTQVAETPNLILDTYSTVAVAFNGALSSLKINNETETTGNAGANNMGGFTLGAHGGAGSYGHIQVKECIGYGATLTTAQRAQIISYLQSI